MALRSPSWETFAASIFPSKARWPTDTSQLLPSPPPRLNCSHMTPIHISWNRFTAIPAATPFAEALAPEKLARAISGAKANPHPSFQLAPDVLIEIPPPTWAHGDFLVYLSQRNWMVRRNYGEDWYVDIGIIKPFTENV